MEKSDGVKEREEEEGECMGTHNADASVSPLLKAHFRVADAWARAILSNPSTVVRGIRGEKGGAEIETTHLSIPLTAGRSAWRASTEILNLVKSEILCNRSRQRFHVKDNT